MSRGNITVGRERPAPQPSRFVPPDLDRQAERNRIAELVKSQAPFWFDEATGDALDTYIDKLAEQWIASVRSAYAQFVAQATFRVSAAQADLDYFIARCDESLRQLVEMDLAAESAARQLSVRSGQGRPA